MFHGTRAQFDAFDAQFYGQYGDHNSSLGVYLCEFPEAAAEYAKAQPLRGRLEGEVLAVLVPARSPYEERDYFRFFGFDETGGPDPNMGPEGFLRLRESLRIQGVDLVDYEDDEEGPISVALNPEDLIIVGRMSVEEARLLGQQVQDLEDPFDSGQRSDDVGAGGCPPGPKTT